MCIVRFQDPRWCNWGTLRRQEVPLHLRCFHQRKNLQVSTWLSREISIEIMSLATYDLIYINNYNVIGASLHQLRWRELSSFAATTSITSRSTTVLRRDTRTWLLTAPQPSPVLRKVTLWPLDSADPSPRPWDSMWSRLRTRERAHSPPLARNSSVFTEQGGCREMEVTSHFFIGNNEIALSGRGLLHNLLPRGLRSKVLL